MKHIPVLYTLFILQHVLIAQGVSVNETGTAPHTSAMMDIQSLSRGVLLPRLTTAQRMEIGTPAAGR